MLSRLFGRAPATFTLQLQQQQQQPGAERLKLRSDQSLLQAALDQGLAFPHSCRAGGCGACKCRLVSGKVKELTDKSYLLSAAEMRDNTILACQSLPRSDLVIELPADPQRPAHPVQDTWASITGLAPLAPDILSLSLRCDVPLQYTAGQFARLGLPGDPGADQTAKLPGDDAASRSYSFATACDPGQASQDLNFIIRRVAGGAFTEWLFTRARSGDRLRLRGPFGDFRLHADNRPILAATGGSGFAPIQAMLEQALAEGQARRDLVLFFGARRQRDLYGQAPLAHFQRRWSGRFEVVPVLSDEPADSGWRGRRGWVPEAMREHLGDRLAAHQAYLCGPPPMVDACAKTLAEAGLPRQHIHCDKFLDQRHGNP